jgi:hypothetical protein
MRIKLTTTISADSKHGLVAGRVFDAVTATGKGTTARWVIVSDAGEKVSIFSDEAVLIER